LRPPKRSPDGDEEGNISRESLQTLTVAKLKELCKDAGISTTNKKKAELIASLEEYENER
jgi:hypothetical protein